MYPRESLLPHSALLSGLRHQMGCISSDCELKEPFLSRVAFVTARRREVSALPSFSSHAK